MQIRVNESIRGAFKRVPGNREYFYATQKPQGIKICSSIISMSAVTLCRIIADPIYESLFDNCIDLPLNSLRSLWPCSSWWVDWKRTLFALFICCCWLTSCTWKFIASFRISVVQISSSFILLILMLLSLVSVESNYFTGTIPKTFVNNCFIAN